jgi:TRAP-type mannitol/chloroaromatic compound transport system substrate-binding protein
VKTNRRAVLAGATVAATAFTGFPAPAISRGLKELKMVTDWPKDFPGLDASAKRLAQSITDLSDERLEVTVYPAGSLVRPLECFDAVSAGAADMYHSVEYYYASKSPALNFFSAVPWGLNADELTSWFSFGGGQALWDKVSGNFDIKPLCCGNTGVQMGGWFNKEVNAPEDFKGLRYRMPGLGAEVLRRMGATVVTTAGSDIAIALKSGAIDASEWVGPWLDIALGLDKAASYYYYPGFHEPGTAISLGINKKLWDELQPTDRKIIETAAAAEITSTLAEFNSENTKSLKILRENKNIKILPFDDKLIKAFGQLSKQVLSDTAAKDPLTQKVYDSYMAFLSGIMDWEDLSERAYLISRRLALS